MPKINENFISVDEKTLKTFAERITLLRTERDISQLKLGEILGYSRSTISCYEHGTRVPDMKTLTAYSEFFDVPVDYLLGKIDVRKPLYQVACFSDITQKDFGKLSKGAQEDIRKFIEYVMNKEKKNK